MASFILDGKYTGEDYGEKSHPTAWEMNSTTSLTTGWVDPARMGSLFETSEKCHPRVHGNHDTLERGYSSILTTQMCIHRWYLDQRQLATRIRRRDMIRASTHTTKTNKRSIYLQATIKRRMYMVTHTRHQIQTSEKREESRYTLAITVQKFLMKL